jgi:hypothetical protein
MTDRLIVIQGYMIFQIKNRILYVSNCGDQFY